MRNIAFLHINSRYQNRIKDTILWNNIIVIKNQRCVFCLTFFICILANTFYWRTSVLIQWHLDRMYSLTRKCITGELGYDGPLYDGFLHMTDDMLGPDPMHIKYSSYVYDGFCIWRTNFPGPNESVISKFTCIMHHIKKQFLIDIWVKVFVPI